ncbi:VanZ family protein [Feifania hominis]|uniref:VanZ family protein n=1 Tax=Feifania hominis TaxID=2763660 RepID=A0A926DED3_9FIRM|nr:VanZ family protein [Feifania hominis]MBC8537068.1 VanZ family protein [Feifania hominis]
MPVTQILSYCLGALRWAAALFAVFAAARVTLLVWRGVKNRPTRSLGQELGLWALVFYGCMLVSITVIRGGDFAPLWLGGAARVSLVPLRGLIGAFDPRDLWPFCYNLFGNLLWFVPVGLSPLVCSGLARAWRVALAAAGLSALIELSQLLLGTGVCDIDDWLLNIAGALLGYLIYYAAVGRRRSRFPEKMPWAR